MYKFQIMVFLMFLHLSAWCQTQIADQVTAFKKIDSSFTQTFQSAPAQAIKITERLDSIATYLNSDSLRLKVNFNKALVSRVLGYSADALEGLFSCLKFAEKINNVQMIAKVHYEIAISYQNGYRDYANSFKHQKIAYEVAIANKFYKDTTFYNYSLAESLILLGKAEEGIQLLKDNIEQAKKTDRYVMILGGLETLALIYYKLGNNQSSIESLYQILPYLDKINNNYNYMVINLDIADMNIVMNKWDSGRKYMNIAAKYASLVNSAEWYEDFYKVQSRVYDHDGKYKEALTAHKLYVKFKDSVNQEDYRNKIAAHTARYGLEKKQAEILLLQKDNALQNVAIKQRELQRNIVVLCSMLLIVLVIASFKIWMNLRTQKLHIAFSRTALKNQESDRQRIAHELHDSIGQNILFIKNQVAAQPDDGKKARTLEAITTTIEEVRNIAKDLYPNQLDKYGLGAAVNSLADKTMEATNLFMSASLEEIDPILTKENKINCYRMIQECVANTVKHANAKAIRITGVIQKGKIALQISDNGQGFEASLMPHKAQTSFGLMGIEERTRILGGKFDVDTSPSGTRITITLPIADYAV
jgi:signal transduction histidine kinase